MPVGYIAGDDDSSTNFGNLGYPTDVSSVHVDQLNQAGMSEINNQHENNDKVFDTGQSTSDSLYKVGNQFRFDTRPSVQHNMTTKAIALNDINDDLTEKRQVVSRQGQMNFHEDLFDMRRRQQLCVSCHSIPQNVYSSDQQPLIDMNSHHHDGFQRQRNLPMSLRERFNVNQNDEMRQQPHSAKTMTHPHSHHNAPCYFTTTSFGGKAKQVPSIAQIQDRNSRFHDVSDDEDDDDDDNDDDDDDQDISITAHDNLGHSASILGTRKSIDHPREMMKKPGHSTNVCHQPDHDAQMRSKTLNRQSLRDIRIANSVSIGNLYSATCQSKRFIEIDRR